MHYFFMLIMSIAVILVSCTLFTNVVERAGERLGVGDGVVGSVFAAVGTCLPETMIPILAIAKGVGETDSVMMKTYSVACTMMDTGADYGQTAMGAILGAPFMLSCLGLPLLGIGTIFFRKWRGRVIGDVGYSKVRQTRLGICVDRRGAKRDLTYVLVAGVCVVATAFLSANSLLNQELRIIVSLLLVCLYVCYVRQTIRMDLDGLQVSSLPSQQSRQSQQSQSTQPSQPSSNSVWPLPVLIGGAVVSTVGIMMGANWFINAIEVAAKSWGISSLILSVIIAPIATELPEKFNSLIWLSRKQDTLAFGNITGAMVFQSCVPTSIGILLTSWDVGTAVALTQGATLVVTTLLLMRILITEWSSKRAIRQDETQRAAWLEGMRQVVNQRLCKRRKGSREGTDVHIPTLYLLIPVPLYIYYLFVVLGHV